MNIIYILLTLVVVVGVLMSMAQSFKPRRRNFSYKNTANIRGSSNICIQQNSNLDLEVMDDKHILVNGEEIYVPRRVRNKNENFKIEQDYNDLYINGYRYDFITKEFDDGE